MKALSSEKKLLLTWQIIWRFFTGFFLMLPLAVQASPTSDDVTGIIPWLLKLEGSDGYVPFREVVRLSSGHEMLEFDAANAVDLDMLKAIEEALGKTFAEIAKAEHPIHKVGRINEASRHFEERLGELLDALEGYTCGVPPTREGRLQGSGYPDLRFCHTESGRVFYLDPKVHQADSETSSFRTFYFEPKVKTGKINDDATHLIIGLSHEGRKNGLWSFTEWKLVDLYHFEVRLKAEFQASNREMYRPEAILTSGLKE
jgi:hypothetical protein